MRNTSQRKSRISGFLLRSAYLRTYCFLFLLLVVSLAGYAQNSFIVTGKVTDENGEPVIGASIAVEGTATGTMSDIDGSYTLNLPDRNVTLRVSYIGYIGVTEKTTGRPVIDFVLREGTEALDEVVVVGYGIQKKVNLTGSVASVNSKELASRPLTNLSSGLGGLLPGVQISQSSGKPDDDGATISIRGLGTLNESKPLIIIDGIEGDMNAVNPNDVESVNVLKDAASSAIYGARGANGVVLITTKKGAKDRTSVSFSSSWSTARPAGLVDYESDFLTYMRYMNTASNNNGAADLYPATDFENWQYANEHPNELNEYGYPYSVVYPNTDWYDEILRKQWVQSYNLSASGGSDRITYNLSLGYLNNPGIMKNSGLERYNGRINAEAKITNFLTVGTQTWFMKQKAELGDTKETFNRFRSSSPGTYPQYDGKFGATAALGGNQQSGNPETVIESAAGNDWRNRFVTTWYARIDLMKGLNFETKFNYTYANREKNEYANQYEVWNFASGQLVTPAANLADKTSAFTYERERTMTVENLLRYNTSIAGQHNLAVLLGHNEFLYKYYDFTATGRGMTDPSLPYLDSLTEPQKTGGKAKDNSMRSFFGRINYDYRNKYLFEANLRYDGSSRFAEGNRWSAFPSFSVGWRLEQESFMPERFRAFFQNFKLRGSWGKLGNNSIDPYLFLNKYEQHKEGYYSFGNTAAPGLIVKNLGNSRLRWEATRVWGAALETNFFDQRASVAVEYYDKYTDGILYKPTMNGIMGNKEAPKMNLAEVSNKGIEVTVGWNDRIKEFRYSAGLNFSYNRNRVEKYRGRLSEGWVVNEKGEKVWQSNFGKAADGSDEVILEGHAIKENRVIKMYKGDGSYYNADGSVNVNGGPSDGMIRTEKDLEWIQAMLAAGNTFQGVNASQVGTQAGLYYGDLIYADVNGDGKYGDPSTDRVFTGRSKTPKWLLGFNVAAEYKGFDFSMIWQGAFQAQLWGCESGTNSNVLLTGGRVPEYIAGDSYFYDPEHPDDPRTNISAKYPRLKHSSDALNSARSEFWLTDASYLRLKNIQLGYTLPQTLTRKAFMKNVRVYVSGENLLTITSFTGLDPESQQMSNYPTLKQFAFGLNINF